LGVEEAWLNAAFEEIDKQWGDFDNYVANGLQLSPGQVQGLRSALLE